MDNMGGHPRQLRSCTHSAILAGMPISSPQARRAVINPGCHHIACQLKYPTVTQAAEAVAGLSAP